MIALLAEICFADRPTVCADRVLAFPAPCSASQAETWEAAHPGFVIVSARCAEARNAVAPLELAEVAPGVFVHEGRAELPGPANAGDVANVGFVVGEAAVAVIDSGGSRAVGEALHAAIRERTGLPVRWLIHTHMHPDHVFGASVFREAGATLIGHAHLATALANRTESYLTLLERAAGAQAVIGSSIVLPDETVTGTRRIDLGGRVLELEAHRTAHTDNDLTVLDVATATLWTGDLVFARHLPVIDGSVRGWLDVLDDLSRRPIERIVPGHGAASLPWPAGVEPTRTYLRGLVIETQAALDRGEGLGEASGHVGAGLRGSWLLFDAFNGRNATAVYQELEWE